MRPWLQDFKDYAFDKRIFGVTEIRAQIRGADDAGAVGWMLWNPRNDYTAAALRQKEASGPQVKLLLVLSLILTAALLFVSFASARLSCPPTSSGAS